MKSSLLKRHKFSVKPPKFSTMRQKVSAEGGGTGAIEKKGHAMSFFDGFEKAAGVSAGNLKALAETTKRIATKKKPPGTVDLGQWWKQPLNTGPKWKESLAKA